ncbi:MAG TPA: coenzyme F420-0:L-glutamate ligase [Actinomycetota bacterium]|nr:coenzyme F420-0:L-glutamate ligase [Actinomycetota bacterium]
MSVEVVPITGIPEIAADDDLAALIADRASLRNGDVVAVTQKAVSKAEGRVVRGEKEEWVAREARRIVARRGDLVIAETRHGFVCANAGVDASNVPEGLLTLLPIDPDGSAAAIRDGLRARTGVEVGVVVTDTFGRPWRRGVVNVAIGGAGLPALVDLRGTRDAAGRVLEATVVALADEVAAAAGLVMGKAEGIPVAVVRGLRPVAAPGRAADLVRPPEEDLFRTSPLDAIAARRTVRSFGDGPVPREVLVEAVAAALTAPVPHGSRLRSRPWTWVALETAAARMALLGTMAEAWARDLRADGTSEEVIRRRLARSDALLGAAPVLLLPFLSLEGADEYADPRRRTAERDMFVLATGASIQNLLLALHARGFGAAWVSASLFCRSEAAAAVGLGPDRVAMGVVAAGPLPPEHPPPRPPIDPADHLRFA